MRVGGSVERAILFQPKHISFSKFQNSLSIGKSVRDSLVNLTPEFLLRGVTEISYKNWSLALSNLWITIEQLTDHLWKKHFLVNESYNPKQPILGRTKSLLEDNRTWSVSVKQEILFQSKIIDQSVFGTLYPARQSRNRLVHDGKSVDKKTALNAFVAVKELLSVCMENSQLPLRDVDPFRIRFFRERDDSKEPIKAEGTNSGGKVVKANFNEWIEISKTF